jgi:transmembrane sensor
MHAEEKNLLRKFLYANCTPEESRQVQELLQRPDIESVMQELTIAEWQEDTHTDAAVQDILSGWKRRLNARIIGELAVAGKQAEKPVRKMRFLRYAAVWAGLLLASGSIIWQFNKKHAATSVALVEKTNVQGQPARYQLPDSSWVYLGAGSKLAYAENFAGNAREITLSGEAFFDVKQNVARPFIIITGNIRTEVLGTSFKVQAFASEPVEVAVATGKVGVIGQAGTLAVLTAGRKVTWHAETGKAVESEADIYALTQWQSGNIVFEDLPMDRVAAQLQRRYGITIQFMNEEVKHHEVSGTFPASKAISKIMHTLAIAGKFRYETADEKTFRIYTDN